MGWHSFETELQLTNELISEKKSPINYGITFLDDFLDGIARDDLILITAKTGGGKTELATNIAYSASKQGKKVHYFALEAHRGEIGARIKFKQLTHAYYFCGGGEDKPDYQKWIEGKQKFLDRFNLEIDENLKKEINNLKLFYTDKDFNADTFESNMYRTGEETDLIILDHLHYFDFETDNENIAFKKAVKQIKNIVSFFRKPVVIVTQLRKAEKYSTALLPSIDDIHGSSDIVKIATRVIVTGPAKDLEMKNKQLFPTYMRILKNRKSSARTHYTGLCIFDNFNNSYQEKYKLGVLKDDNSVFELIDRYEYPSWVDRSSI